MQITPAGSHDSIHQHLMLRDNFPYNETVNAWNREIVLRTSKKQLEIAAAKKGILPTFLVRYPFKDWDKE